MTQHPTSLPAEGAEQALARRDRAKLPRLGFLGVGWIGRHRLEAVAQSGAAEIAALADFDRAALAAAAAAHPRASVARSLEELLGMNLGGLLIATPTALHADQAAAALQSGLAVFCQKPLGRTAAETRRAVAAARRADRLLCVDMSYRFVRGVQKIKQLVAAGAIGEVYAADLVFHNAYGPDKPWYYERRLSGGGCVIDLGIHLVDLALWMLDFPPIERVSSRLYAQGKILRQGAQALEDFGAARIDFATGATAHLACSWRLSAGRDAVIGASFFGTKGGLALHNVSGSFYDFRAERFNGTSTELLDEAPDHWGGRAAVAWAEGLAHGAGYEPAIESAIVVADVIDKIYGREQPPGEAG